MLRRPRIAACFFGITRSLRHTFLSIEQNVLAPLRAIGDLKVISHFFTQADISNPRSAESGSLDLEEYKLLDSSRIVLEAPDACLQQWKYAELCLFRDYWGDGYLSLRNLVHQLHSLREVWRMSLEFEVDVTVFLRPDLLYMDSFSALTQDLLRKDEGILYPDWAHHGGINDRFCVCLDPKSSAIYARRAESLLSYYSALPKKANGERFLMKTLVDGGVRISPRYLRASRVRFDGRVVDEPFRRPSISRVWRYRAMKLMGAIR